MYPVLSQYINDVCNPIGNIGKSWNEKFFTSLQTVFCQNYCRYSSWLSYLWTMRYQWKLHWIMQFSFHFTMSLGLLSGPSNTLVTNFEHSIYQYFTVSIFLFPNYNNSSVFIPTYKIILHSSICISCNPLIMVILHIPSKLILHNPLARNFILYHITQIVPGWKKRDPRPV